MGELTADRDVIADPVVGVETNHRDIDTGDTSFVRHIMKTTIEIADDLFKRARAMARKEKTTLRALIERGLRLVLEGWDRKRMKLPPLVTVAGTGLTPDYQDAPWERIRAEVYRGRGA